MADALKSLIVFIVILALAGTATAVGYYYAIDLPQQEVVSNQPPENVDATNFCKTCMAECKYDPSGNVDQCIADNCLQC